MRRGFWFDSSGIGLGRWVCPGTGSGSARDCEVAWVGLIRDKGSGMELFAARDLLADMVEGGLVWAVKVKVKVKPAVKGGHGLGLLGEGGACVGSWSRVRLSPQSLKVWCYSPAGNLGGVAPFKRNRMSRQSSPTRMVEQERNILLFSFENKVDMQRFVDDGPWGFVLKRMSKMEGVVPEIEGINQSGK